MKHSFTVGALLAVFLLIPSVSIACSRAVYFGKEGQTVTGRTMDWFVSDMDTNMWLYPRGLERTSNTKTPLNWKSKYGSVLVTIYEGATADGMNEKGLVANMLYLAETKYPAGEARGQAAHAADFGMGPIRARHLRHHGGGGRRTAEGGVPHGSDHRAHRRTRNGSPVHIRRVGRLGDLRVHRRQAHHPSRQAVSGDDQLANLQ